jgi:restriction system protein
MGDFVRRSLLAAFAFYGQFIVPFLCLLGSLASFLKRRKREGLVNQVTHAKGADALAGMSWREFEMLVGEAFRLQGYKVTEQGGDRPDGGVDLVLRKGSETYLVQCKQWKAFKVGVDVVRELYGVMAANGAAGGFVITSGTFTADAQAFANGRNVKLVDGAKLFGLIQQAKASASATAPAAPVAMASTPAPSATSSPSCPVCQASMVRRIAKKGANAGSQFWGCSQFPACRGTR